MLDLPLRSGDEPDQPPAGADPLRPKTPGRPHPPQVRGAQSRRRVGRARLAWIGIGLVTLLVVAYLLLWPKPPEAAFSPDPLVLARVRVGTTAAAQTLSVTNVGERPMAIRGVAVAGADAAEYGILEDGCSSRILEPEEACAMQIEFAPAAMGLRQARLDLEAEMPGSPAQLALTGEGTAPLLAVSPPTARFGSLDVGATSAPLDLEVLNEGTAALEIDRVVLAGVAERDFRLTRNDCSKTTLAPGERCALRLVFVPRAAGSRAAEISLRSDALEPVPEVDLSGVGIWTGAAFAVEPKVLAFGRHLVGTDRLRQRVQVVNRQSSALQGVQVTLAETGLGFTIGKNGCSGRELSPGEGCRVEVDFQAAGEGAVATLLQIGQRDVGTLGVEISGTGVAPRWVLGTTALEFDPERVDSTSGPQRIELRNEGSAGAKITRVEVVGDDASAFRSREDECAGRQIAPGSGCTLGVRFRPHREGTFRAEIRIHAAAGTSPQRVVLTARAIAPRLSLDREMIDFGRVHRTTLQRVEITVSNRGTAPLELSQLAVEDDPAGDFQLSGGSCLHVQRLPASEGCTLQIAFGPTGEGRSTARLRLQHDGISGPRELPLAGIGLPPPIPQIVLVDTEIDFGPQPVGVRSSIQTVTLRAAGTGRLELREFSLEGPSAGGFHIVPATCHAMPSLQPGSDCAVGIRFQPAESGDQRAQLVIRHNAGEGVSRVELRGEGLGGSAGSG